MQTGWQNLNGTYYYLDPSTGVMYAGTTVTIDGKQYSFDSNGVYTGGSSSPTSGSPVNGSGSPSTGTPSGGNVVTGSPSNSTGNSNNTPGSSSPGTGTPRQLRLYPGGDRAAG